MVSTIVSETISQGSIPCLFDYRNYFFLASNNPTTSHNTEEKLF